MRSAELRDLCVALSEAHSIADASFIERHVSGQEGVLSIGSDPNEWIEGEQVLEAFEQELGIHAGEKTEDGEFSLTTFECLGGCGWGPVVAVDWRYREPVHAEDVPAIVRELRGR